MFAVDAKYLGLWLVKGRCLRDYNFIMLPKRLVIGPGTSAEKKDKEVQSKMEKKFTKIFGNARHYSSGLYKEEYACPSIHLSVCQSVKLNVFAN